MLFGARRPCSALQSCLPGHCVACWNTKGKKHRDSLSVRALLLFQWESNRVSFSTEREEQKRDLITQHQSFLTFIARCDSAGYEGWKLTLKFPWQIIYQICLHPHSHVLQTCRKFSSVLLVSWHPIKAGKEIVPCLLFCTDEMLTTTMQFSLDIRRS